jgi:hypothetical protein
MNGNQQTRAVGRGHIGANEDAERYSLQIDLMNNFSITLTIWKNGDPPTCTIWEGNGERDFVKGCGLEDFREFAEIALGNKPLS